ncbi:MAG TPA: fused MFS/spermidine synthase [Candidatus Limnocylindrales bacterium]
MRRSAPIYLIFVLSGAAGLIYEVVWARQLVLVFGNTTQAVSAILTGFFGGMAIGSIVGGRLADRVRSPLRLYGFLEIALVVVVIATPVTFGLLHEVYRGAYGALAEKPQLLALTRFALSLLALGPATVMMGATLPTLTRHLSRGSEHLSRAFGHLYAANTFGAIIGTLVSGLVLIELLGLTGALLVGAGCSALAGILALVLERRSPTPPLPVASRADPVLDRADGRASPAAPRNADAAPVAASVNPRARRLSRPGLALVVAFISGLTSLGYQVLWTRLLSSGTGNSTYVFTTILAIFLTGIAFGAIVFSAISLRLRNPIALLASAQIAVAILAMLGLVNVIGHPVFVDPVASLEAIAALRQTVVLVVLPATIVMGIAFPAASRLLDDREGRVGTNTGRLLAANTLGAISGTFVIPFVVIPAIGSPSAVVALALVNAVTGVVLAARYVRLPTLRLGLAAAGIVTVAVLAVSVARTGVVVDPAAARVAAADGTIAQSAEDEIASVQAGRIGSSQQLWVAGTSMTILTVDARLMPIIPVMLRPESKTAVTVAFGMGSSFRTALIAGLRTDAVELVPSVPKMFRNFYPDADAVFANPNGRVLVTDGRNYMELTDRRYDIIVTDPPPPIESSGVSVISSLEYYRAGRSRLNPGGVMMQWVPYGQTIDEFKAHIRTFRAVFPNVLVAFGPGGYGFFMVGSEAPLTLKDDAMRATLERPGVLDDLSSAYDSPEKTVDGWIARIHAAVWIQGDQVAAFAGDGPMVTDDRPLPEYFLFRRLFGPQSPMVSPGLLRQLTPR